MASGCVGLHTRMGRLILTCFAGFLLLFPVDGSGDEAPMDGGGGLRSDDWITINKDYSSQRYVDLDEITPRNVDKLQEICELQLNEPILFSSGLLKVGRTLYVNTGHFTAAFDAVTCELRWRKVIPFTALSFPLGSNNRGSAYLDGKIFRGTVDGRLIALNANTGEILWDVHPTVQDVSRKPPLLETFISAPIAWQGKVFIGIGISDVFGTPGRLMAFDAGTGKQLWHLNTTPGNPPAPSGGGFWTTYSLDPNTGEVFGPVANPYPDYDRNIVPGDKDFTKLTDSVISVDAGTGRLNWYRQVVPLDDHDYDLSTAPTLYRTSRGGHDQDEGQSKDGRHGRDMMAIVGKFGRVFGLDRDTQLLAFDTPATTLENDQEPLTGTWTRVCPGANGGAQFNGAAYHPGLGAIYVGMIDFCSWYAKGLNFGSAEGDGIGGYNVKDWASAAKLQAPRGWITAIDGKSGRVLWQHQAESQVQAGLVPTKSGLLFAGDTHGNLLVFNAKTGELLRSIDTGRALNSGLISYQVGGQQYVAAAVGGATENPSTVAGPLKVSVYGLHGSGKPNVVTLDRLQPPPGLRQTPEEAMFAANCGNCHGSNGQGGSAPPLMRQSELADPELLKHFLTEDLVVPMPHLYPGVLEDKDVEMIAKYLRTNVFKCDSTNPPPPQSCNPPAQPVSGGTPAWKAVYSVLTSPRCINCHPVRSPNLPTFPVSPNNSTYPQDYPRQGDDRHPHLYGVIRGDSFDLPTAEGTGIVHPGKGPPFERCTFCHGNHNDPVTGIPGTFDPKDPTHAPFWALAPAEMAWESSPGVPFTGPELCTQLKDPNRNGHRELSDILEHLKHEPLVNWAFNPGTRPNGEARTTPPISHNALIENFEKWMTEGAPCPNT